MLAAALVLGAAKRGIVHNAKAHLSSVLVGDSLRHSGVSAEAYSFQTMDGSLYESPPAAC